MIIINTKIMISEINTILDFISFYLILAQICKQYSSKIQIHSIVHCVLAIIMSSYVLFIVSNSGIITSWNIIADVAAIGETRIYQFVIFHSIGYFIADTIDIMTDDINLWRQVYIIHHIVAVLGLLTVFKGTYVSFYAIWTLETGGIVHHLKHVAEVYNTPVPLYIMIHMSYHIIYISTRILLTMFILSGVYNLSHTNNLVGDIIGASVGTILVVQNFVWWIKNIKKTLRLK